MKKIYIAILAVSTSFFSGCADDYLDVDQTESISTNDIELFNNNDGAKTFVTAIYNKFLDWNMSSFSWIGLSSITSDDADKGGNSSGDDKDVLDALTYNSSSISIREVFEANYDGINRCNQALDIIPKLDKADPALRERLMGEAKFLRAYMYFTLVKIWGGVPIIDHLPNPTSEEDRVMQLTRKTQAEVYAYIEKDLNEAIAVLSDKSEYPPSEIARASKGAAYTLLAKVSLYQKKWQQVVDNCNLVTGYELETDYASIFRLSGENGKESIFEIQSEAALIPAKGIQQYSQVQAPLPGGWGFNVPSQNLVNAYEPGDVRKDATILFTGIPLYDGKIIPISSTYPRYNYKSYSSLYTYSDIADTNLRCLRYAEVLLMKAEALNELNLTSDAIGLLDQIRHRAKLDPTTALSQDEVRIAIWKERRVELAMEHDRFFDLVRTGQAEAAFDADNKIFIVGKHELFPLPDTFMKQANGLSKQNPGYN